MEIAINSLLDNAENALFAAIEIHNKPVFQYRYQICTIAVINAWELLLKAFIATYEKNVNLVYEDGTSKQFEECLACVKSVLGKDFILESESIDNLYSYRCQYIHFYCDNVDTILYCLIAKNVELYSRFLKVYFNRDLTEKTNLILLPIGFRPPVSPIDFLSNRSFIENSTKEVQSFIKNIITSTNLLHQQGIEESILFTFNIALINENRVNNADIVAAIAKEGETEKIRINKVLKNVVITNDPNAQAIKIEEINLFKEIYTESYHRVVENSRMVYLDFLVNNTFHDIMKQIKNNPNLHKIRYLNVDQENGSGGKSYFSKEVYKELNKYFTLK